MRGIEKIIACRKSGKKPVSVSLWVGYDRITTSAREFDVVLDSPSIAADFRALVGLSITLFAKTYTPAIRQLWEKLQQYIVFGVLKVEGWDDPESVFIFSREQGEKTLSDWTVRHG